MSLIEEMQKWKDDLEELGVEKGRADGRLEQAMADLKAAGFDSIEAAQKELAALQEKKRLAEDEAKKLLEEFKIKYADHIE